MTRAPVTATVFGDLPLVAAARDPRAIAVAADDVRLTASEVAARAQRAARALHGLGARRGDRVGILMPNCPAFVDVLLGATMLGAVVVPINARYRATELAYVVADAGLSVLVTSGLTADRVDYPRVLTLAFADLGDDQDPHALRVAAVPQLRACVLLDAGGATPPGFLSPAQWDAAADAVEPAVIDAIAPSVRLRDTAMLLYTSGTTANPKGCVLTHEALTRTAIANADRWGISGADAYWAPLPLFHMAGVLPLMTCLWAGAKYVTSVAFDPVRALAQIAAERTSVLYGPFPAVMGPLIDQPAFATTDLSFVRVINHGAPEEWQRRIQRAFPQARQVQSYGCTELGGVCAAGDPADDPDARALTCGRPWPGMEVRVVDPLGKELPVGGRGEIVGRGFGRLEHYHGLLEHTGEAIDRDGWFHTGDIGSYDDAGRIRYHGRLKDMLKVGGENVAALEVESFLVSHPAVRQAVVVGVPDERLGEVCAAFLELHPGSPPLDLDAIVAFARDRIASYKVPRHVRLVTEWPMSATKVQKFRLRDALLAELETGIPA